VVLQEYCWPVTRLGEALGEVARASGMIRDLGIPLAEPENLEAEDDAALATWMRVALRPLQIEAEPADILYEQVDSSILEAGPALVRLPVASGPCLLAIVGKRRRSAVVIGPDRKTHKIAAGQIARAIREPAEAPFRREMENVLGASELNDLTEHEREVMIEALLRDRLGAAPVGGMWLLRLSPSAPFTYQVRQAGLFRTLAGLLSLYTVQYILGLVAWWIMGAAIIEGRIDSGWLLAWALVLVTGLPLQVLSMWYQGLFAIGGGGLLKRRLLYGALRLEPEEMRNQGAGQLLGRVIESEAVESLALNAGFASVLAALELAVTVVVLGLGAGGWLEVSLFCGWIAVTLGMGWGLWTKCVEWTKDRLGLTHDLVEKMIGHRTRLAQERHGDWHREEDPRLERYVRMSRQMDRRAALMAAIAPQGWLILGIAGLAPAFVSGHATPGALAVGLGGVLLASSALQRVCLGFSAIAGASIAWSQVAPLFHAAARPDEAGSPAFACAYAAQRNGANKRQSVLEASNLSFRHYGRSDYVLDGVNLRVLSDERILLEGASGGGKSTLAAILSGIRLPDSGAILLGGLDRKTLGSGGWRQRVAMAPQFHENHILTGTVAFNLLMGRAWPPKPEDLAEAEAICRELGLEQMIEHMPAGLSQMIGESGWQLSHGERSRLFIARALLQRSDVVIFDESLGTLDPESLFNTLRCASQRANALIVIAHP
jgi:ATP-binding cassette subfamily B protein